MTATSLQETPDSKSILSSASATITTPRLRAHQQRASAIRLAHSRLGKLFPTSRLELRTVKDVKKISHRDPINSGDRCLPVTNTCIRLNRIHACRRGLLRKPVLQCSGNLRSSKHAKRVSRSSRLPTLPTNADRINALGSLSHAEPQEQHILLINF